MKNILFSVLFVMMTIVTFGQTVPGPTNGTFEGLIVDKFYPTAAAIAEDPNLNANSVTYRFFVDMTPGSRMSDLNGKTLNPIYFKTSTQFYNNPDGDQIPLFRPRPTMNEAKFYDSWLTVGAYGKQGEASQLVPLSEDLADGVQDGVVLGAAPTPVAFDPATLWGKFFGYEMAGNVDGTIGGWDPENVIWYAAGGQYGVGPSNSVCVAQVTTDGDFEMLLNVQILNPVGNAPSAVSYVGTNANDPEWIVDSRLYYSSVEANIAPVATITSPVNGSNVFNGTDVTVTVNTSDANTNAALQAIKNVEFRVDGGAPMVDVTAPYSFVWNSGAERNGIVLEARATNVSGDLVGPWAPITINVTREIIAPTVSISANDAEVVEGDVITFTAAANQGSSAITGYVFTFNGVAQPSQMSNTFAWTSNVIGNTVPVSVAVTTADGTATANMTVKVISGDAAYEVVSITENCNVSSTFCVPVRKIGAALANVTGFEFDVIYPVATVRPTGQIDVYSNGGGADNDNTEFRVNDLGNGTMHVEINLDQNSVAADGWDGTDVNLFCIGFAKTASFMPNEVVTIGVINIYESTVAGKGDIKVASAGTYTTFVDNNYTGFVKFWANDQPIFGVNPVATRIQIGSNAVVNTDASGMFTASFGNGSNMIMHIDKDISNNTPAADLQAVYGGYDAYLTAKVLVNNLTFLPTAQQVIAMDVDRDGKIGAGDISQIQQRSVRAIDEFYGVNDWVFFNESKLFEDMSYRRSTSYPSGDATGFSKDRVPAVPYNINLSSVVANPTTCPVILDGKNVYYGVALGDVDGSWATVATDNRLKSAKVNAAEVVFDLQNAYYEEEYVNIPVMISAENTVNSLDFSILFDSEELSFENILNRTSYIEDFSNSDDNYVALTSYSLEAYEVEEPIFSVRFRAAQGFNTEDINEIVSYVNGVKVNTVIRGIATGIKNVNAQISVYPNPASTMLQVNVSEEVSLQLFDINGKSMYSKSNVIGLQEINVQGFAPGVYIMKISNDRFSTVKRVLIQR